MTQQASSRAGFSLVELTIVIAIIGLLIGGIVAGRSMIRQGEMNRTASQVIKYAAATDQFRSQYKAWPGDMVNASNVWGAADGDDGTDASGAVCSTIDSTGSAATCNGNGDQIVGTAGGVTATNEYFRFWQHLANAGLVEGRFSGKAGSGGTVHCIAGNDIGANRVNVPAAPFPKSGHFVRYLSTSSAYFNLSGNAMVTGRMATNASTSNPIFTPQEAKSIDEKIDDGMPGMGRMSQRSNTANPDCTTSDDPATSAYNVASDKIGCAIFYWLSNK